MKRNGTTLSSVDNLTIEHEDIGDSHQLTSLETPMRNDAFELDDEEKMAVISKHFEAIMDTLGLDLTDDSLKGTPHRVAKMYVKEIFSGLDPKNKPKTALFGNKYKYDEMLIEKNIVVRSFCEHHFVPIVGKAHVAYKSNGNVIGLSKINRIVDYYARRPQVQERLTVQVAEELKQTLGTEHVAVVIDASHMCVKMRGIKDMDSSTITASYHGDFKKNLKQREEFIKMLQLD